MLTQSMILSASICPEIDAVVSDGAPVRLITALTTWGIEHRLPACLARILAFLNRAL
jgi:hypothetical protein